ncbi:MAG: glycosyltransferase family 2 protein [Clostridia bacterium]|nr:glycosyltransferase family 2 protein [Clostridia bacterium]
MKTLSIVVPVYNTEDYIRRCLDSLVMAKDKSSFEVIVVSDGSKDASIDIAKEYEKKYPGCIVIIEKENGGHGSTINKGLEVASGKYFRVLDSDDWFDTMNFEKYLEDLKSCDEDLVLTSYTQEYTFSGEHFDYKYDRFEHGKVYTWDDMKFDKDSMYFTLASSSYKTELLKKCGLHLFEKTFYVDMQFNIYPIPYLYTVRFLDYDVYRYFIGRPSQSMSRENLTKNLPQHEKVLMFIVDYYESMKDRCNESQKDYMALIFFFMYYSQIDIVCQKMKGRHKAYKLIKSFDRELKKRSRDLYENVSSLPYLRWSRRFCYLNVWLFNRLFSKAIDVGRRLRRK